MHRTSTIALIALLIGLAPAASAQGRDSLAVSEQVVTITRQIPAGSAVSFCVTRYRAQGGAVALDSIGPARPIAPECGNRPVLMIRPWCYFTPDELALGAVAPFVVLVCLDELNADATSANVRARIIRLPAFQRGSMQRAG